MPTCILCIGTNEHRKENLLLAQRELLALFPAIRFASEQETEPLHLTNPARFSNQVALFNSNLTVATLINIFKKIECQAGRLPKHKQEEKVCLDIDLLAYDEQIIKPEDWMRSYVVKGVRELTNSIESFTYNTTIP